MNTRNSIGMTLTDMLDELIGDQRMDPQLAMKILSNFDRAITETLNDKVKARLTFKVNKQTAWHEWGEITPRRRPDSGSSLRNRT